MKKINNPNTKRYLALFAIVALAITSAGAYSMFYSNPLTTSVTGGSVSPVHVGFVTTSGACKNGDSKCLTHVATIDHNVYTNFGKNATRDYLFHPLGSAPAGFIDISLGLAGNATAPGQAATDRCLSNGTGAGAGCNDYTNNGLAPAAGTVADVVNSGAIDFGNVSITKTFTCTLCTNTVINQTGLYNSTTVTGGGANSSSVGGLNMFAEANFTQATLQTNDQINVFS